MLRAGNSTISLRCSRTMPIAPFRGQRMLESHEIRSGRDAPLQRQNRAPELGSCSEEETEQGIE